MDKDFKVDDTPEQLELEYKTYLIHKIKELLDVVAYPVDPKILDTGCDLDKIAETYTQLKGQKAHIEKEREFFKMVFMLGGICDSNIAMPDDLDVYCYGSKAYYENAKIHFKKIDTRTT